MPPTRKKGPGPGPASKKSKTALSKQKTKTVAETNIENNQGSSSSRSGISRETRSISAGRKNDEGKGGTVKSTMTNKVTTRSSASKKGNISESNRNVDCADDDDDNSRENQLQPDDIILPSEPEPEGNALERGELDEEEGSSENDESMRRDAQDAESDRDDDEEERVDSGRSERRNSREDPEIADAEEEEDLFLQGFSRFIKKSRHNVEKRKTKVVQEVKTFKNKKENPLRAQLYDSVVKHVKNDIFKMMDYLPEISADEFESLAKGKKNLTAAENVKSQVVKIVTYILEQYDDPHIHKMICNLQLQNCASKCERLEWAGYEMKVNTDDPNHELREKPSPNDSPISSSEFAEIRKRVRIEAKRLLNSKETDDDTKRIPQVISTEQFILTAVLIVETTRRKRSVKNSYSTIYGAFHPKYPYYFIHGKRVSDELLAVLIESAAKGTQSRYRRYVDMDLKDIGLHSVFTSCLRVPSKHYLETVKQQLSNEVREADTSPTFSVLTGFEQLEKRRKMMKAMIDDKQEGGFKSLTFEIQQSNASAMSQIPVTIKFRAKKGNMNRMVADMYERGTWKDPAPYFKARDTKSNFLKLKHEPGRGFVNNSDRPESE